MWRSVFLHEFIDHRIGNFQALPGRPTPPSFLLQASDALLAGTNAVAISPGRGSSTCSTGSCTRSSGSAAGCG